MKAIPIKAGDRYDKLVVLETPPNTNVNTKIVCRCDCGRSLSIKRSNLLAKRPHSCGMGKCHRLFVDITNQKFGFLTALETMEHPEKGFVWRCLCSCGNEYFSPSNALRAGHSQSCGCKSGLLGSIKRSKAPGESNLRLLWNGYKDRARRRGYEFELSMEQFVSLINDNCYYCNDNCYYCGVEPKQRSVVSNVSGDRVVLYNGIDRMDNGTGYTEANCVTCCGDCNAAKNDLSYDEFIDLAKRVIAKHIERSAKGVGSS